MVPLIIFRAGIVLAGTLGFVLGLVIGALLL